MSRPSEYSPELTDQICALLSDGKSLRSICRAESMPCVATIFNWLRKHPEFVEQYARAKEESADALADEILDIADDSSRDVEQTEDGPRTNNEAIQRSRLRVDTRKWIASKLKPKKYGDKLELAGDKDRPLQHVHTINLVDLK